MSVKLEIFTYKNNDCIAITQISYDFLKLGDSFLIVLQNHII